MIVPFIYTRHVRLRMQQRGLLARQIETTVKDPDRVVSSFGGRRLARKMTGSRVLEVVYKHLNGRTIIITAYWLEEGA